MASSLNRDHFGFGPAPRSPAVRVLVQSPGDQPQANTLRSGFPSESGRPQVTNGNFGNPTVPNKRAANNVVGIANISNQLFRKTLNEGFEFTLMVVGRSGLGKSTFVNSLFQTELYNSESSVGREATLQIKEKTVRLVEKGVALTLTLIDTPGFGDLVDNSQCWDPIIACVDRKFSDYLNEETKVSRESKIPDTRVHCCLYFIEPSGHGLTPLDIEFMKRIHDRVNVIPIIGKADTMTREECAAFKQTVADEIAYHGIKIYHFPATNDLNVPTARPPFAVVGSSLVCDHDGKMVRCRKYPWGIVEVENIEHNDFVPLRDLLIRTHMMDLIDMTRCVHYENFRIRQLAVPPKDTTGEAAWWLMRSPLLEIEKKKREIEEQTKHADFIRMQAFQSKLAEKEEKVKKEEEEVNDKVARMKRELEEKRRGLDQKRTNYDHNRETFQRENPFFVKYNSFEKLSSAKATGDKGKMKKWVSETMGSVFRGHNEEADI